MPSLMSSAGMRTTSTLSPWAASFLIARHAPMPTNSPVQREGRSGHNRPGAVVARHVIAPRLLHNALDPRQQHAVGALRHLAQLANDGHRVEQLRMPNGIEIHARHWRIRRRDRAHERQIQFFIPQHHFRRNLPPAGGENVQRHYLRTHSLVRRPHAPVERRGVDKRQRKHRETRRIEHCAIRPGAVFPFLFPARHADYGADRDHAVLLRRINRPALLRRFIRPHTRACRAHTGGEQKHQHTVLIHEIPFPWTHWSGPL